MDETMPGEPLGRPETLNETLPSGPGTEGKAWLRRRRVSALAGSQFGFAVSILAGIRFHRLRGSAIRCVMENRGERVVWQ
jgi:hypothetical protein